MSLQVCCCGASPACASFEACSAATSTPGGPAIKSVSVNGTQVCEPRTPNAGFPPQLPANKIDFFPAYAVEVISVVRGTPVYNSSGSNKYWSVPVDFEVRVTSSCPEQCDGDDVTWTISHDFRFSCAGSPDVFSATRPVGFPTTSGTLCNESGSAQTFNGSVGRDISNFIDTATVAASAIPGSGCTSFDANLLTMDLPVCINSSSFPSPPSSNCRDVTRDNFPNSSGTGACIITIQWSLITP